MCKYPRFVSVKHNEKVFISVRVLLLFVPFMAKNKSVSPLTCYIIQGGLRLGGYGGILVLYIVFTICVCVYMCMCVYRHIYNTGAFLRGFVFCGYIYPSGALIAITAAFPFIF